MIAYLAGKSNSRVVHLEDSVQIGRHIEDSLPRVETRCWNRYLTTWNM